MKYPKNFIKERHLDDKKNTLSTPTVGNDNERAKKK